jgi:hypothetical protein
VPEWGDEVSIERVPVTQRIDMLLAGLALRVQPRGMDRVMEMATLPCYRFRRPRDWKQKDAALQQLVDTIAG